MMADLIERSAVLSDLESLWDYSTVDGITASTVLKQVKTDVRNVPAVDAVEVRHGRWTKHKDYPGIAYLCSECHHFTTLPSPYCPDCGARMDGKDEA